MANALDLLRNMAKQPQTQESASRAINSTYDFDSWRREDDTLRDLAMQRAIEENRRRYQEAVAPALESNRQRESFLRDYGMYPEEYERMQSAKRQGTVGLLKDNTVRTNRERDALIQELKGLQLGGDTSDYAGWATDELSAAQIGTGTSRDKTARMQEIRNRLAELDLQLGNGEMSYGGDRLVDTVTGGAKGWAGEQATFFGKGAEVLSRLAERLGGNTADYAGWATDELSASQIGTENDADKRLRQLAEARAMQETGRRWSETGASEIERAKNGLGQLGRLGVDLGANAVQMGLDAGTAALTGGSGALVPLFTRASGGGMREAEAAGADLKHQLLYGSTVGAVEAATEMLTGGLAKVYGAGGADELVERAVRKMTTSEVGRRALLTLSDMAGEGVEEIISDIVNPYAKALYDGGEALKKKFGSVEGFKEAVSEELYDGLVGALMGGFGSVTKTVSGDTARTVQRMGYADQAEGSLRSQWGTERGAARDATDYAELIARAATGEELNTADRAKLESRPTAQNVLQEVTTQRKADAAQEEHALTGTKKERLHGNLQDALQSSMSDALEEGSSKVTESEAKALVLSYEAGTADAETFYNGAVEAFRYGALGLSEHEARKAATFAGDLSAKQFQDAWKLGAMRQSGRADANTQEGRDSLTANLRFLGTHAQKAASAYESTQSVKRYGEAMKKAVLYASNGLDIQEAAGQARDGERADIVSYLTDAQIQTAQEIGQAVAAERAQTVEQQVSRLADLRTRLTDALTGTPNLRAINSALRSANEYLPKAQADLDAAIRNMTDMQESGAWSEDEAAYQAAVQQVEDLDKQVRSVKESIKEAEAAKAEEEKKQPTVKRKEGQVTYASEDGEASGVKYKAVDRSKLTRTQAATANVAEAIAKATGLEIRVVDMGKGIGGEYLRGSGGIVYLNINAAFDGKNISILSLSHELTHWLQEYAPKEYMELKRVILDEMMKNPDKFEDIFGERSGDYSDITIDEITDEMVANACQTVLMDAEAVQRIVNEHRSLAERIRDFILRIVDDIKAAFSEIDVSTDRSIFREIHAAEGALDQIREIWLDAFGTATENFQAEQATINENTATEGGETLFQYTDSEKQEILHLKEQVKAKAAVLAKKEPVANLKSPSGIDPFNTKAMVKWAQNMLNAYKNVDTPELGNVILDAKRIDQSFNYLPSSQTKERQAALRMANLAAYPAIPRVLKRGIIIEEHTRHKGNKHNTVTFAAPVLIDGKRGNMAVVVMLTSDKFYKVHSILTTEGELMTLDKKTEADSQPAGRTSEEALKPPRIRTASEDSVSNPDLDVNSENEQKQVQKVQFSRFVEDPDTLKFLDKQEKEGKVVHTYKSFLEIDGKLYPPMASMKKGPDGKWKMTKAMEVGRWEESVGDPSKIEVDPKNGRGYFTLKKDDGSTVKAAYNPYQHSSNLMINDQFTGAYSRPGLVTYECIIPESELTSGYRADYAKDAVGVHSWKAGPVAGKLVKAKGTERQVYLSRWLKPVRKVPDAEVAQHYKELLEGTDIAVPSNVVPPSLLHALEDAGVKIEYDPRAPKAQFQMISEVEETDRLVAVHNKSVSGLRRMLKRGGVPFPSIAIKRAGTAHQGFGDVSIVFPKSTIDPEVNRQNRLYSNDAWTPTEPRTEYEVDIPYKIKQRIEESVGSDLFTALNGYSYLDDGDVARALENSTGNLFEAMKGRRILKYAYLKSIGKEPEITQKEADLDGSHKYKNEQLLRIFEQIPADEIENANWDSDDTLKKIADVLNEQFLEKIQDPEKRERIRNSEKLMPYSADKISIGYIKSALFKYRQNGNRAGTEIDTYELDRVLRDNTEVERDPGYKAWIEKTFGKVIKNEGIPNGKDPYTSSGNRRSFKQTHVPATLENIVAQMQKEQERGIGLGGINLRGAATRTYKTVEEMRADRGRLLGERVSDDVYDSYMKGFYGRLHDMSDRVKSGSNISAYDSAEQILLEVLRDSTSKAQMGRKLQAEGRWIRLYDGLTDELWQLRQDVQNMPAPYFEAKPRRVVYPEEALAYIIPDSSEAADVREMLEEDGRYKVLTYKAGDEADRLRVINSIEGAQFQRWDEPGAERIRPSMEEHHWGENFPPVMYNTNLPGLNREGKALHEQAKNGDAEAARRIVARSVKPEKLSAFAKQHRGARLVAVRSEDGKNKIPYAYAAELAKYGLDIDDSIVQVAKAWHTGSNGIIRMIEHAGFDGDVKPGQEYILVDDVLTFGGTLNDLRMYIESKGGKVVACTTLAVGRNGHHLAIRPELVQQIYDKHGENIDTVLREEGIAYDVSSLTDRQGRYIRDLDVDTLRDRGAQERASEEYRGGKETGSRKEELTGAGSRQGAIQYQRYDDTFDDTKAERRGREEAYTRIQNENMILNSTIRELKKTVKGKDTSIEKILSKFVRAKRGDAEKLAKRIMREYSSKADTAEVTAAIKAVGDYYLQTPLGKLDEGKLKALARDAASLIAQGAEEVLEETRDEVYGQIRDNVKGRKLSIRPEYAGELDQYGGYNAFKKENAGKFTLTRADRVKNADEFISVDQFYQDLNRTFGDAYFPEAGSDNGPVNEGEMVKIIADAFEAGEPITVNPFDAYMGEAVEAIANNIAFRVMNDNVLRPMLPAEAEKALDDLEAAGAENAELRKKFDQATARGEILKDELEQLKQEGKLSKSELVELRDQVYDLTAALKKANNEYAILQKESEERIAQVREEGAAKVAQVRAKERERAAKQIQGLKDHYQEIQQKAKERREESASFRKYRDRVQKKAKDLYELLMTNSDKKHVPEVLKKPVAEFLESIDFTSKRQLRGGDETRADRDFGARMRALERALSGQQDYIDGTGEVQADLGGYVDISQENLQFLRDTIQMIDTALKDNQDFTVNRMSGAQLKQLANFLSNLNTAIRNMNNFMANARFESVREAASKDIESLKELGKAEEKDSTAARRLLIWENGTPYYVFRRFGEGGRSIFDGFTKGWEKLAFNAQEVINFTEKLYTDKEVNEWKNDIKEITLSDGSKIRMTTAQIMELSVLLNREQARKHIEAGGIRIGDIDRGRGRTIHDTAHYHLTLKDIQDITGMLSSRQVEVAKALQKYMAGKGADWGNEISMRRFGYNFYTEGENYYPIRTDANDRPMADTDAQMNSMFRLLNLSSSKSLNPKASNALIVGNIFDTFADHMSDMAKLNGLGLPILDAIKWFNYKERVNYTDGTYDTKTMQAAMEEAYGQKALSYFRTLMKDINGMTESGDRGTNPTGRLMSNYKIAAVGANLRVALLQPTSYIRALTVLKPQYLAGVVPSLAAYREAMKYSGTAVWKSLGYYDTDIAKGLRGQIQHDDSLKDKIVEKSMMLAEKGDQLTWSRLWTACKRQAAAETGAKGEDLMQATADLFREAIYSSQVMDSTLTRSEIMRGKTMWSKMNSAFMAEPTLSYNILLDAYSEYRNDVRRHGKAGAWQRNSAKIGKALAVYMASATVSAIVESLADAGRDDDDESYWDKVLEALLGEDSLLEGNLAQDLTIIGKVPFLKNFISTLQGYTSGDMSATAFNNAINAINIWKETAQLNLDFLPENWKLDKATKVTYYGKMTPWGKIYKTLQAVSQLSGIAASNLTRDATGIWNTIMNGRRDDWKIRTYDNVKERETGGFIKAILGGNASKANEIMAKTESKDSLKSGVRSELKDQLLSGEIDQEDAVEVLRAAGYKEKEITNALNEWNVETDYGFKWSDRKEAYQNGEIDRNTMSTLLQEVGGKKAQDAEKQLDKWDFEIRNGWNPDNLKSLYIDGDITRQQALSGLQTIGGKSAEDAQKAIEDYDFEKAHGSEFDRYGLTVSQAKYYYNNPGVSGSVSLQVYADQVDRYGLDTVKAYHDEWKSTGITIDQYSTYKTGYSNCKGTDLDNDGKTDSGSKKAQVLQVIDALPVSNAVKDALYEKNGWSLKTIGDAPWRRR